MGEATQFYGDRKMTTNSNKTFNNSIVMSSVKGNLCKDPVGPFKSQSGREYLAFTIACNHINKNPTDTWYPRVFMFGECMSVAAGLKKGDFIEISHALLNPSAVQQPWTDAEGNQRPQADALMVFSKKTTGGVTIPVNVLRRKKSIVTEPKINKIVSMRKEHPQEATEQEVSVTEEVMATIEEEQVLQALQSE